MYLMTCAHSEDSDQCARSRPSHQSFLYVSIYSTASAHCKSGQKRSDQTARIHSLI